MPIGWKSFFSPDLVEALSQLKGKSEQGKETLMPDFDPKKFLDELKATGELTPEDETYLNGLIAKEKVGKVFKSGFAAQSEFHSMSDKLKNDYDKKLQAVVELQEELQNSGGQSAEEIKTLREELQAATDSLAAAEGKLAEARVKARTYTGGEEFLKGTGLDSLEIKKPEPKQQVNPDDEPITRGRATKAIDYVIGLQFDVDEFKDEYFELTGKYPSAKEVREALNSKEAAGVAPREVLANRFKLGDLRQQKEQARIDELVAKARKEGAEEAAAKYSIPSGGAPMLQQEPPPIAAALLKDRQKEPPAHQSIQDVRARAIADLQKRRLDAKKQAGSAA